MADSVETTGSRPRIVGRYEVYEAFAAGGMATLHLGRMKGPAGFGRTVAVKQLHPSFAEDPATVATLLDEARVAARVQHPGVVSTLDVVVEGADILLVLEYVHGESLARLLGASDEPLPLPIVRAVLSGALHGLHAAHEARSEEGEPLGIVHRDVSPQNILVGADGQARVLDFGIAKARGRLQTTREGQVKGKLAYMAPEQVRLGEVSRRTDVFAAGVVLWEALTGARLFAGENEGHTLSNVLTQAIDAPSELRPEVDDELDALALRALERDPEKRFASARELALALEASGPVAPASAVGRWVEERAAVSLRTRAELVAAVERGRAIASTISHADEATRTATVIDTATAAPRPRRLAWVLGGLGASVLGSFALAASLDPQEMSAGAREVTATIAFGRARDAPPPPTPAPPPPPSVTATLPLLTEATRAPQRPRAAEAPPPEPAPAPQPSAAPSAKPFYRFE
jgi:hypothetical protein